MSLVDCLMQKTTDFHLETKRGRYQKINHQMVQRALSALQKNRLLEEERKISLLL